MIQSSKPTVGPVADQLMRRMLNTVVRLQATCASDAEELRRIQNQRQADITAGEKAVREQADREVTSAPELSNSASLGSRLRSDLAKVHNQQVKHIDSGNPPDSLVDAATDWKTLVPSVERRIKAFKTEYREWDQRVFKRAKSMPKVNHDLWRDLDRLDVIHRSVPVLRQALIADLIREVSGAADVVVAAEKERQKAGQQHLANEVKAAVADVDSMVGLAGVPWSETRWESPVPTDIVERLIRLGELQVEVPGELGVASIPALMAFPFEAGLAIGADVANRDGAISLLRALILRLFAAVPPGGLHVKAVDPVSLGQSVAEFRHLSEYDSQLMDEKTWTSERDIERLMNDLSDHLEVVISTYLRGQFETIDDYNQHAGEVAQPYRVLTVFDYPSGFSDRASRQLLSLIENGPRCGVYTILHYDREGEKDGRHREVPIDRIIHNMQKVTFGGDRRVVRVDALHAEAQSRSAIIELSDPVGEVTLGLLPDEAAPVAFDEDGHPETGFAKLLPRVGVLVRQTQAKPPAVTLDTLLPVLSRSRTGVLPDFESGARPFTTNPATWWQARTSATAVATLGRSGAQGVTSMFFSSTDVAGGAIMVGLPRSGKTTSLHSMILTMAMLYSPEELELYLIDAKHGVEFKVYEDLPHARMVSVHSEREFSLAVLKSIEAEIRRRAELMKAQGSGVANITEFRRATGGVLPRIVVIVDEFHELFEEADTVGLEAFAAFSNIVRMGPFSGVHIVVASQTLSSMPAMDRPTLMLLPQRVAFMCNEYDSEIVMGDSNKAPRLLSKTGEGLFNPSRGEESKNQPFQGLYIPTEERSTLIRQLGDRADAAGWTRRPRVFDGDAVVTRPTTTTLVARSNRFTVPVGEPFTLADVEALVLPRTRGANVLVLGDRIDDESIPDLALRGVLHSFMLAGQAQNVEMTVVDCIGDEEAEGALTVMEVAEAVGARYVRSRSLDIILKEFATTVVSRTAAEDYQAPIQILVLFGLQRALSLNPIDPYSWDEDNPSPSQYLAAVLSGGPEVGVHVVIDVDRARAVELRLGTDVLGELTLRIAGSAADQKDLGAVSGSYGDIPPLRHGQLLIGNLLKGSAKRARGYEIVSAVPATDKEMNDG